MGNTVLFLCPHGAAKSVLAAAYFNQLAQTLDLPLQADSAGTEPDPVVAPVVVDMMKREGINVSHRQPRHVTAEDLNTAHRIISLGCSPESLGVTPERVEQWLDIPLVSQNPDEARTIIRKHVEQLVKELQIPLQAEKGE
jgi:arsenate reductase (thioredoxin)